MTFLLCSGLYGFRWMMVEVLTMEIIKKFFWGDGEEKYRSFMQKRATEYTYDGELNRKA